MQKLIAGILVFSFAFLLVWLICAPTFEARWRNLKYGSTQGDVQKTLGSPTSTGANGVIGAGDQPVVSWEYNRGSTNTAWILITLDLEAHRSSTEKCVYDGGNGHRGHRGVPKQGPKRTNVISDWLRNRRAVNGH